MCKVSIVGCGDIGSRVARVCLDRGDDVVGWVRSDAGLQRLRAAGIPAVQADLDDASVGVPDVHGQQLFYFAPPPASGQQDKRVKRLITHLRAQGAPSRVVYLSTTGVYGDCQGQWVDETWPAAPQADRARRRLDAEMQWRAWSRESETELVILRVAGIYGPGKLPIKRLASRQPMVSEQDAPITNHIHTEDLVQVCLAAMQRGRSGEVYNVCDGHPASMTDYFNQVADFLRLPRPPIISMAEAERQLSPGMLAYLRESRRLSNRKLLQELDLELLYPNLQQGLPACVEADENPLSRA
jgi:nucleoside-diphosphate-sugar epimerase